MTIEYADYSRIYYSSQGLPVMEIRRNGIVYANDFGDLELDAKGHYDQEGDLIVDYVYMGWGNGGPSIETNWWYDHPEERERLSYWERNTEPISNSVGYNEWEHVTGEAADARIDWWISQLPSEEEDIND